MTSEVQKRVIGTLCKGMTLAVAGLCVISCGKSKSGGMNMGGGVREYAVMQVDTSSVSLKSSFPASIQGVQDVEIRPRVGGFITKLCVDEGASVKKGQALFLIDKVQYEAAVKAAEATVQMAEAKVATASLTYTNKKDLAAQNIIGEYDLQTAQNDLMTAQANLAQAKAQLVSAQRDLTYTTVTSPSDGVVGTIPFRVGSLVSSSSATPLTVVSDISKVYVYFTMNEKDLLSMMREKTSIDKVIETMPEVELQLADGSTYNVKGKINAVSGVIETTKGSVQMRAVFANPERLLRTGGSGKVLIPYHMNGIIEIPQKSTFEVQEKKFVYTVSDSSSVHSMEIEVFPLDNGQTYAVTGGLTPGSRIVVDGIATLKNDMKIQPITPEEAQKRVEAAQQKAAAAQKR
ncbi:MAG: efflux RND transporter periplasmic adaptor subunit [Alistipes sp.]|nr:efflux RND transporter periplasmic adaptor subunit [Alistipes sp.]